MRLLQGQGRSREQDAHGRLLQRQRRSGEQGTHGRLLERQRRSREQGAHGRLLQRQRRSREEGAYGRLLQGHLGGLWSRILMGVTTETGDVQRAGCTEVVTTKTEEAKIPGCP